MAFQPGYKAFLLIDGVAGTGVNVSTFADDFQWPQSVTTVETSAFGSSHRTSIPSLTDGDTLTYSGPYDVAAGTFFSAIKAAQAAGSSTCTVVYGPAGSVSGQAKIQAETWITAYNVSTQVAGRAELSVSLQVTGAVTNSTW